MLSQRWSIIPWRDSNEIIVKIPRLCSKSCLGPIHGSSTRFRGRCPTNSILFWWQNTYRKSPSRVRRDPPFCVEQTSTTITVDSNLSQVQNIEVGIHTCSRWNSNFDPALGRFCHFIEVSQRGTVWPGAFKQALLGWHKGGSKSTRTKSISVTRPLYHKHHHMWHRRALN